MGKVDIKYLPQPIRVDEGAAKLLIKAIPPALAEIDCEVEGISESKCDFRDRIEERVEDILCDGEFDRLEAPVLYDVLMEFTGDCMLTEDEFIPMEVNAFVGTLADTLVEEQEYVSNYLFARADMCGISGDEMLPSDIVLACGELDGALMIHQLKPAMRAFDTDWDNIKRMKDYHEERSESFWNFTSGSNLLGLSAYITEDGTPFSDLDLKASRSVLAEMESIGRSLGYVINEIEEGRTPKADDARAAAFFESPYANMPCACDCHDFSVLGSGEAKPCSEESIGEYFGEFVGLLIEHGAEELATFYADNNEDIIPPQQMQYIRDRLPSGALGFFTGTFTHVSNELVSLDTLIMLACGGLAGRAIGGTLKGSSLAARFTALRGAAGAKGAWANIGWLALPGSMLLKNGHKLPLLARIGATAFGLVMEYGKFALYTYLGQEIGGEDARRGVKNAYIFLASAHAAFSAAWRAQLSRQIASSEQNAFIDSLARRGVNDPGVRKILAEIEWPASSEALADALAQRAHLLDVAAARARDAARNAEAAQAAFAELELLAQNHSKVVNGKLLAEAKEILEAGGEPGAIRGLIGKARRLIEMSERKARFSSGGAPRKSYGGSPRKSVSGSRAKGRGSKGNGSAKGSNGSRGDVRSVPPEMTELQKIIKEPPAELDPATLERLTGGRVRVGSAGQKDLIGFYARNPKLRSAFWRKMQWLSEGKVLGKKMGFGVDKWRLRFGKNRLLYSIGDDGVELMSVSTRGNMHTGVKWSE